MVHGSQFGIIVIIVMMASITDHSSSMTMDNGKKGRCIVHDNPWNITKLRRKANEYKDKTKYRHVEYPNFDMFHPTRFCTNTGYRILRGQDVELESMPWVVLVTAFHDRNLMSNCTGVLISYEWILTAAHCVNYTPPPVVFTHSGFYRMGHIDDIGHLAISFAPQLYIHPEYNETTNIPDIALISIHSPGIQSKPIRPMCLPLAGDDLTANQACTAAGWGITRRDATTSAGRMQKKEMFYDRRTIDKIYVKASPTAPDPTGICLGDSGGPLVCRIGNMNTLVGILSVGTYQCDNRRKPAGYTRVHSYLEWIRQTINTHGNKRRR